MKIETLNRLLIIIEKQIILRMKNCPN